MELKTSLLHPSTELRETPESPSLACRRHGCWNTKQTQGWLPFPSGGTPTATLGHTAAPLLEGSSELAVRPKPPPVSLALTGEPGERTTSILQHGIPLTLNPPPEVVLQDGFLQFFSLLTSSKGYAVLCLVCFHAGYVLALSFWLKETLSLLALPALCTRPQAR